MTEQQWAACEDPLELFSHAEAEVRRGGRPRPEVDRRWRLVGCAVARLNWDVLPAEHRRALEAAEEYADAADDALEVMTSAHAAAAEETSTAVEVGGLTDRTRYVRYEAQRCSSSREPPIAVARYCCQPFHCLPPARKAAAVRDVLGGVLFFRPSALPWPDARGRADAVALARAIYDDRDWMLLPVLADALEDAGCPDAPVLDDHLRSPGPHSRGCWALDLVLGKE